jgi:hypothetical protein
MKTLRVEADQREILARLRKVRPDSPRRWGRMTSHQMICHLNDSFGVALGTRRASPASGVFQRTFMKWFALQVPLPWPHGIGTRPDIDQVAGGGTKPAEFGQDVKELERVTLAFAKGGPDFAAHPIFGRMSMDEWMRWGYLHLDHHLRQFGC